MQLSHLQPVWFVLVGLAYVLVASVLVVLASQRKQAIDVHDRAIAARAMRRQYMEQMESKKSK